MKAVLAYNYNMPPKNPNPNPNIGGPTSAFTPYSGIAPPPEVNNQIVCELKSRRKDAFRQIKKLFGLN